MSVLPPTKEAEQSDWCDDGPEVADDTGYFARYYQLRYQELFDFAPDAQFVTDAKGIIREANHAAAALFGHSKEYLIGKPLGLCLIQEARAGFYQCLLRLKTSWSQGYECRIDGRSIGIDAVVQAVVTERSRIDPGSVRWHFQDITPRKHAERANRELLQRLLTSQENERRRISREIHDQLGQELTAISFGLKDLEAAISEESPARRRLGTLKEAVDRLGRKAHELAFDLRPAALDDLGLPAAIEAFVQRWSHQTGIPVGLHFASGYTKPVATEAASAIYRVVQEALNNVAKHANASNASVIIEGGPAQLMALIEDDGQGFDADLNGRTGGLGLLGMYERLSLVGGSLQIESSPGRGTTIRARIPCVTATEAREP